MKAVLISIQPKWCELIASGEKTVEVRKTKPKIETPFKCYIYCTNEKGRAFFAKGENGNYNPPRLGNKKVIGEFVCDRITEYECSSDGFGELATTCGTCLTYDEIINYCNGNDLYGWHISDLVIYDKPKELSEFFYACDKPKGTDCSVCLDHRENKCKSITRPPQSWCYVEELR